MGQGRIKVRLIDPGLNLGDPGIRVGLEPRIVTYIECNVKNR